VIDLYAAPTSNGLRAKIMLDECGLPYKLHPIDLTKGENRTPEFLKLNPMGAFPVIVDPEGPGGKPITMAQSVGILTYLAEKSGKFMPKDAGSRPIFWQALNAAATDLGPTLGDIFAIQRSPEKHQPSQAIFEGRFKAQLKVLDGNLGRQKYVAGDEATIADFATYAVIYRAEQTVAPLLQGFPNLERWRKDMAARPGTQKGLKFA
jgi:GST-like protein